MNELKKKFGLIMSFWNDDTMFVMKIKWKLWTQKYAIVMSK
jgi:hypothetical protein